MLNPSRGAPSPSPTPAPGQPRSRTVLVTLLHPPDGSKRARTFIAAWAQAVPAAFMEPVLVEQGSDHAKLQEQIGRELARAGLDGSALVLAGIAGAEKAALKLVFSDWAVDCAEVLACGNSVPSVRELVGRSGSHRTRVRLVWTADDPLFCSLRLGRMLRRLRSAGIDAQGAVLGNLPGTRDGMADDETVSAPLASLSGAYISELVAVALCRTAPARPLRRL